jgi:Capsid protein (F protein)
MARTNAYSGSNAEHKFNQVPSAEMARSTFNRSSNYKTTFDSGNLIPIYLDEILPGDSVSLQNHIFARMATPIYPLMDNLFLDFFWFFVPNRLVWDKWQFFLGEEETPGDAQLAPKYKIPQVLFNTGTVAKSLADYFGLPVTVGTESLTVNALPFRGYNLIWSEFFRDENLQSRPVITKSGGLVSGGFTDTEAHFPLRARGKRKDYATSCLPWPQKGPTVLLPLGSTAPVTITPTTAGTTTGPTFIRGTGSNITGTLSGTITTNAVTHTIGGTPAGTVPLRWASPELTGTANLAGATSATINELRQSFQIQRLLERDARGGTRLTELIKSHFGVTSPDARLQRPEYLGGGSIPISVNPVPQTSETTATSPQGNLSSFATASGQGGGFTHSFTEHGFLFGFVSVRADLNYQNSLHKMWTRSTRFDHYWPVLQSIGEQAVLNQEVNWRGIAADTAAWGYQERWAELRYKPNLITGQFRSQDPLSLDSWHLAQDYSVSMPALNDAFIQDKPPIDRVVAVPSEPEFLLDAYFRVKHTRCLPVFSVPGMIDHF